MVWVIGHRGARQLAVENSMAALQVALSEGADGVECDVQLSADGEPVLFHDDDLRRLTGDRRRLAQVSWRELRGLRQRVSGLQPQPLAHLDELLEWAALRPLRLNVELKVAAKVPARPLVETLLRRIGECAPDGWVFSSFDRGALDLLGQGAPLWRRGALVAGERDLRAIGDLGEIGQVHPGAGLLSAGRLQEWQAQGWPVWPWTLNGPEAWQRALELAGPPAIEAIITDDPSGLRRFVEQHGLAQRRSPPGAAEST
ncbi:MAG: glycerophosphodiester phosphodiesterase [Deltaproteobacteria bacterium]|nr:glycerophosphodiester phosphodiesterase [Deltaproteobacteria bacterium]